MSDAGTISAKTQEAKVGVYTIEQVNDVSPSSSSPSLMDSPPPGRVGAPRNDKPYERKRRPSDHLIPDADVLNDLELQAQAIASNIDMCLRDLRGSLRGMSDLTLEMIQVYSSSIHSTCDNVDAAIRNQYKLIAKTEELNNVMQNARKAAQQVKDIRRVVVKLDSHMQSDGRNLS